MVNPLARVYMNNVINKTSSTKKSDLKENKADNLTSKEEKLILEIIRGEREVKENKAVAPILTLDEVVEKIKSSR
ncbi:hypothetical protein KQI42_02910 [Tissierella sp. MSJ-40]|uniref:Uncharacterized protein n=1 Tax=Tissierella simiarum TaxID=2841534 RepID=A0ABS6E219_9FIRM|nr:hypothetical protein [Tissierella simiarum]MBU5436942.1 hypothetical protein [Tissierella simiarum]